jgi:NADPH-dependent 2,4-dienoyl-CoA reductase/sulfur reductase-like enzyme
VILESTYDVAVVGAGPAGLAAAAVTAGCGLSTVLLDENPGPGGQVYRAIESTPVGGDTILDRDYWDGRDLVLDLAETKAQYVPGAVVWSLARDREIGVSVKGRAQMLRAKRVILATGAMERPFPIPNWTLPGVMTVGAAQTLLKASGLVPEGRLVLAGCGPLLWLCAYQLLQAGCAIQAILDTTDAAHQRDALHHAAQFAGSPYVAKGIKLMAAVRRRVRVIARVTQLAVHGTGALDTVSYRAKAGRLEHMPADHLLLHHGVIPNVNLAMSVGIPHTWDDIQVCWTPVVDGFGTTPVEGIAIAGDGAGIAGAWAAADRGRLAGIAAVRAIDPAASGLPDELAIRRDLAHALRGRAFLDRLYRPAKPFRIPADDTVVCRCEEVTAGQIRATVKLGVEGPNQMKSFLRCGMGPCQGRLCGVTVTEVIAEARCVPPSEVGYYRLRPPVKPITLAELAALPQTEEAVKAVVRL